MVQKEEILLQAIQEQKGKTKQFNQLLETVNERLPPSKMLTKHSLGMKIKCVCKIGQVTVEKKIENGNTIYTFL